VKYFLILADFMNQTITQVDALTNIPFKGNPAVVCVLATSQPDDWM
jgi:predicted PhzF superfamily epimerase YddE/YHI9